MTDTKKPRGAPKKDKPASSQVHFRCTPEDHEKWSNTAKKNGLSLSAWLKLLANKNA